MKIKGGKKEMSTITFYIAEDEKVKIREIASKKGLTAGKFASDIVRTWIQNRMPPEEKD